MTIPHATWQCFVSYLLLTVLCRVFDCMDEVVFHTPILSPLRVHHLSTTEQQQHKRNTASPRATGSPTKRTFYHIKSSADWLRDNALKNQSKKPSIFIFYLYACLALFKTLTNKCYLIFFSEKKVCVKKGIMLRQPKKQQKPKWRLSLVVIHPSRQLSMQHLNKIDWLINDRQRAKPANPVS